jgi:hypothetical protein
MINENSLRTSEFTEAHDAKEEQYADKHHGRYAVAEDNFVIV